MSSVPDSIEGDDETEEESPAIACHRATEKRRVFTEEGNTDGWIATDLTVKCRQ